MRTLRRPADPHALTDGARRERWIVARPVAQFALIGLAGLFTVGVATLVASQRIGQREAITDARTTTLVRAQGLVEPAVTNTLVTGDPAAVAAVARAVEHGVLDATLVRVKIWTPNGTIVYSNEPRLIGQTFASATTSSTALHSGLITAGVSNLTEPENRYEVGYTSCSRSTCRSARPTGNACCSRRTSASTSSRRRPTASGEASHRFPSAR